MSVKFCVIKGFDCSETGPIRRGLCVKHYSQFSRLGVLELVSGQGESAKSSATMGLVQNILKLWNASDPDAVKAFLFSAGVKVW